MNALEILGIGVCATGMPDWGHARQVLRGQARCVTEPLGRLDIPWLPVTERRRVNTSSRLAIHAAMQAVAHLSADARAQVPSVFASADGDGIVLANTLEALVQEPATMSPTLFHNSVFNAPAGYWTIASGARLPSTTVSAGAATFAAGLMETGIEVVTTRAPVLYIAFDMPFPDTLHTFDVMGDAFACALLLGPSLPTAPPWGRLEHWDRPVAGIRPSALPSALTDRFQGNAAACVLPLLEAIATRCAVTVAVPYHDGDCLEVGYAP